MPVLHIPRLFLVHRSPSEHASALLARAAVLDAASAMARRPGRESAR